jgi:hypothetical protein
MNTSFTALTARGPRPDATRVAFDVADVCNSMLTEAWGWAAWFGYYSFWGSLFTMTFTYLAPIVASWLYVAARPALPSQSGSTASRQPARHCFSPCDWTRDITQLEVTELPAQVRR